VGGVLVIGAAGLLGRAVLTEAERAGEAHAVVARASATLPNAHVLRLSPSTVEPLARLLERLQPDAIVNGTGRTVGTSDELMESNVEPVAALIEAMRMAAPGARLVHLGSAAEYAAVLDRATDEEAPLAGSTPYAAAKVAAFRLLTEAAAAGMDTVVARVFNPIGARMPSTSLPGRAARLLRDAAVSGAARVQLGPLGAVRDYVDLRDVGTAVHRLASEPHLPHRLVNVASGRPTVVRDLVHLIAERAGFSGEIDESGSDSPRSRRLSFQVADISRIGSMGWVPTVPLDDSVDALVASIGEPVGGGR
jgi:NDP-hexose 4-ketoreductase